MINLKNTGKKVRNTIISGICLANIVAHAYAQPVELRTGDNILAKGNGALVELNGQKQLLKAGYLLFVGQEKGARVLEGEVEASEPILVDYSDNVITNEDITTVKTGNQGYLTKDGKSTYPLTKKWDRYQKLKNALKGLKPLSE